MPPLREHDHGPHAHRPASSWDSGMRGSAWRTLCRRSFHIPRRPLSWRKWRTRGLLPTLPLAAVPPCRAASLAQAAALRAQNLRSCLATRPAQPLVPSFGWVQETRQRGGFTSKSTPRGQTGPSKWQGGDLQLGGQIPQRDISAVPERCFVPSCPLLWINSSFALMCHQSDSRRLVRRAELRHSRLAGGVPS